MSNPEGETGIDRERSVNAARRRRKVAEKRQWVDSYKAIRGCRHCGIKDPDVLDLHHREGTIKVAPVSVLVATGHLIEIQVEVTKCDVACANCHRKHHANARRAKPGYIHLPLLERVRSPFEDA